MKIKQKTVDEAVLEEGDFGIIKKCLNYVKHRKDLHGKCEHIENQKLNKLLKEFN